MACRSFPKNWTQKLFGNLKNNSDNKSNFEKIKDDYADNNASEDLQPCIDEIFPKIQK